MVLFGSSGTSTVTRHVVSVGSEGGTLVLVVPVPSHCILVTTI